MIRYYNIKLFNTLFRSSNLIWTTFGKKNSLFFFLRVFFQECNYKLNVALSRDTERAFFKSVRNIVYEISMTVFMNSPNQWVIHLRKIMKLNWNLHLQSKHRKQFSSNCIDTGRSSMRLHSFLLCYGSNEPPGICPQNLQRRLSEV